MIKTHVQIGAFFALALTVAACGGGGGGSVAPATSGANGGVTTTTSTQTVPMTLKITIPAKSTTSSTARSAQYLSPTSGSFTMTLVSTNGAAATGAPQGPFNLTPGSGNAACVAATAGTTLCTYTVNAPVGSDIFSATTYGTSNGTGTPTGTSSVLLSVAQSSTQATTLALTGPLASVTLVSSQLSLNNGNPNTLTSQDVVRAAGATGTQAAQRVPAVIQTASGPTPGPVLATSRIFMFALDANGNQIINPTTFDVAVALKLTLGNTPAGVVGLGVTYAGLAGEPSTPTTVTADQATVSVYSPSDVITMTIVTPGTSTNTFYTPSVVAQYTPAGGAQQTSNTLTYSVLAPPVQGYLTLTETHTSPLTTNVPASFTFVVTNTGSAAATSPVTLTANYSAVSYTSFSGAGWSCHATDSNDFSCTSAAPLAAGQSSTVTVTLTPTGGNGYIQGTASATGIANTNGQAYSTFDSLTNSNAPALAFVVTQNLKIQAGGNGFYQFNVQNNGNTATSGTITVTTTLPANVSYNTYGAPGWTCGAAGQVVTCTSTTPIGSGSTSNIELYAIPAQSLTGQTVQYQESVSGGGSIPASATVAVNITGSISFDSAAIGNGNYFNPGDHASLEVTTYPTPSALNGTLNIRSVVASGTYTILNDTCTGPVLDGTFAASFPTSAPAANSTLPVSMAIKGLNGAAGPCTLTIGDSFGNQAQLTITVDNSQFTVQSRNRSGGAR